ncbi:hypothetical protein GZH47_19505 [Paenibacillus rhizovicinus]|uniref:Carbohydrate-binding domain-containing protein n=2 Tax=Paenibacillus rhizovicinus TaxID=2704463 RepID=A0A6C0P9Y9_9BACL|nr:hypothetical protein GZH47_19505 [Paenibacillus rhizovicinus]
MTLPAASATYRCRFVEPLPDGSVPWSELEAIGLTEVVTGARPALATSVRACWTDADLRFRFECEDDHVAARMTGHDDPLYEEDVVEIFLDETGDGMEYYELEVSPLNVVFDALVRNDLQGSIEADLDWHPAGMTTSVTEAEGGRVYEVRIPMLNFKRMPVEGTVWRWNAYRIDEDRQGVRHYWAWRPTGAVNYHRPQYFGALSFVK